MKSFVEALHVQSQDRHKKQKSMKLNRKLRTRIEKLKLDTIEIRNDQRCIREEHIQMREKLDEIRSHCEFIKNEAETITQISQRTQARLDLISLILDARRNKDFVKANVYSNALRLLLNNNSTESENNSKNNENI